MKQVMKAGAEWQAEINKEKSFLITFAYHWKKTYAQLTSGDFLANMRRELKIWEDRNTTVVQRSPKKSVPPPRPNLSTPAPPPQKVVPGASSKKVDAGASD
jgi:hypothetical protein